MQTAKYILFIVFATMSHISICNLCDCSEFYVTYARVKQNLARLHTVTLQNDHDRPITLYFKQRATPEKKVWTLSPEENKTIYALKDRSLSYRLLLACPDACTRTDAHYHYSKRICITKELTDTGRVVLGEKKPIVKSANKQ